MPPLLPLLKLFFLLCIFYSPLFCQQTEPSSIKLLFVGDVMVHDKQIIAAEVIKNKSYDFHSSFKYISPI